MYQHFATHCLDMSEKETTNPAPYLKKKTGDTQNKTTHAYFIPVIVTIVVCVIIVATFFDGSVSSLLAGADDTDHPVNANESAARFSADSASQSPVSNLETQGESGQVATTKSQDTFQSSVAQIPPVSLQAASEVDALQKTEASAEDFHNESKQPGFGQHEYPRYHRPMSRDEAYELRRERQRRAYEEHLQQRQKHLKEVHNYRNTVLRRIEKDRTDLRKRMYELDAESRRIRLQAEKRLRLLQTSEPGWSM